MEALFPGRCLHCGGWLLLVSASRVPLCDDCRQLLRPLHDPRCRRCGIELISEQGTCLRCRTTKYGFDSNVSLFPYSGLPKCLLGALKFGRRRRVAPLFAALLAETLPEYGRERFVVVPAPPRRGQAAPDAVELVARALERRHGFTVLHLLQRSGHVQQKSLDFERRRKNLDGKIRVLQDACKGVFPREVVLLDDVFTTGATLDACSRALRDAGCTSVKAATLVMEE